MHTVFTSVNANYLNRALLLAESVKKNSPKVNFVLLLVEPRKTISEDIRKSLLSKFIEFDEILTLEDFSPSIRKTLYNLPVVEACTAIKGEAMLYLLNRQETDYVTYLDPDLYFYKPLEQIIDQHANHDVLLTPHLLIPPISTKEILND